MSKYLLIVSCTEEQRKYIDAQKSILVFNDEIFKMLREELKKKGDDVKLIILSSKFNVIPSKIRIKPYNRKMTKEIAEINIDFNTYLVNKYISMYKPENIVVCLEEPYELAVNWKALSKQVTFLENKNRKKVIEEWINSIN